MDRTKTIKIFEDKQQKVILTEQETVLVNIVVAFNSNVIILPY